MSENKQETMKTYQKVEVAGRLKIMNLEKDKDDEKNNIIKGSITLQYGEADDQQVEVKVYKKELTNGNSVAKSYEKLLDLMENGVTVAKAKELSLKNESETFSATTVRIYGRGDFVPELRLNEYHPEDGEYSSKPEVSMGFGNIAIDTVDPSNFKADFHMHLFLHKIPRREKIKDEETGRLIVEGMYVTYKNEVKPLTFVVEEGEVADNMEDLEKGSTIEIFGDIKIARIVKTKTIKSGFGGKGRTEEEVKYVSELIISGGDFIDEDQKGWVDPAFVKKAMVERETFLEELSKKASESKPKKNGFGSSKAKKATESPF